MQFEFAKVTLTGHRSENQDRVEIIGDDPSALLVVVDGMGGHAEGARASEVTVTCLADRFRDAGQPILDPQGFLIGALSAAHDDVVALGEGITMEQRPRATCAICLVQDESIFSAHIGDSRIYQLRDGAVLDRSRDHSHVELLLHKGVIEEKEVSNHPMQNYVECCLGGDEALPDMCIAARRQVTAGDVILVCSDGLWTGISNDALLSLMGPDRKLEQVLLELAKSAVEQNAPNSDNTSAAAVRINRAGT